jgi:hypothetical protein
MHPTLHVVIEDGLVRVCGTYPITHDDRELDRYLVEITFPPDYPESIPLLREVGGRLPQIASRHFSDDGTACLFVPDEREWIWPTGASFSDFLDGPVRNFLLFQSIVSRGGKWPHGERSHGVEGVLEFYKEILATEDLRLVLRYVEYLSLPSVQGRLCPCGSGRKAKKCHDAQLRELRQRIRPHVAYETLERLRIEVEKATKASHEASEQAP